MDRDLEATPPALSLGYLEEQYERFVLDPGAVASDLARYFESFRSGTSATSGTSGTSGTSSPAVQVVAVPVAAVHPPPSELASRSRIPVVAGLPELPAVGDDVGDRLPFLARVGIFRVLPAGELARVAAMAIDERYPDRHLLMRQDEIGTDLFVVVEGSVVVAKGDRMIAEIHPGEVVGEMSVLDSEPRSADAIAVGNVRVLRLRGEDLLSRLDHKELALGLIRGLTARIRETDTRQDRVDQLINAYRVRGHLIAALNPLQEPPDSHPELTLERFGLDNDDLGRHFSTYGIAGADFMTLQGILERLRATYCGAIGVQFMHIDSGLAKRWLMHQMEDPDRHRRLTRHEQIRILTKLTDAEVFEQFIHRKFLGAKRFSLEGAETLIPLLDLAIQESAAHGVEAIVMGMPHRGRLNVLANILGKSPEQIFREFDDSDSHMYMGRGDVKYHLGYSNDCAAGQDRSVHLSLAFNPSHLEFVGPVVIGRVRAKQDRASDGVGPDRERRRVMGIVLHGDAAFAGQGVVQELLNMSSLEGYATGGTLHIVVNNQIGFTTSPAEGRSTQYATDVAKMIQTPIFHVNGEQPEEVAQVIRWALGYRAKFQTDVIVDMFCYRKHGHNEGDEPAFTQPLMYRDIRQRESVRAAYVRHVLALGAVTQADADEIARQSQERLDRDLQSARSEGYAPLAADSGRGIWVPYRGGADREVPDVETGVPIERLRGLLGRLTAVPEGFSPHPKIVRILERQREMAAGQPLDWGTAEALAFASLLAEGYPIRLSGQDSQRGTFSHRHAVLHDHQTGRAHTPLQHLAAEQAPFQVWNSPLSEIGVLGFDYGFSLDYPEGLVIWEAQFGDFSNVAQVIIDQFITSCEDKWHRLCGLTLFLPHGFEGQGPEHSSARLERFLGLAAEDNIQVVCPTTPAQMFHLLRRQVLRRIRKPLIVMTPKSLLRLPEAVSPLADLAAGGFGRILPDVRRPAGPVRRVLLSSGKVYYHLEAERELRELTDVALVRVEQLYPLRLEELADILAPYPKETPVVWVQEEPHNMGAWGYLRLVIEEEKLLGHPWSCVARDASASPATGSATAHKEEQATLLDRALMGK